MKHKLKKQEEIKFEEGYHNGWLGLIDERHSIPTFWIRPEKFDDKKASVLGFIKFEGGIGTDEVNHNSGMFFASVKKETVMKRMNTVLKRIIRDHEGEAKYHKEIAEHIASRIFPV
jgi:hypothetical protein